MSTVITEIDSNVNELFAKTKVIQKFKNPTESPLELKIFVYKKEGLIFTSFNCQIGDSIKVKSKVIKKEKAEVKYTDSIASGNAAIFVSQDPYNENRTIINMGNIPPKTDVIFISEFIHPVEASKKYEFEIFRNLPIFEGKNNEIFENTELKGRINIKTRNEIIKIEKNILMKDLKITEEKYQNEKKNDYLITYHIEKLPKYSSYNLDYIPTSKIYFDINTDEPLSIMQNSTFDNNEFNYIIQYKHRHEYSNNENIIYPALFIFLVDQSGSMWNAINIAKKALQLFIQSLPVGSFYQIIGFGSNFIKYDETPKEYNKENITSSLKIIEILDSNLGGTDIYSPLKDIYDSSKNHDKIKLPRNIFLLTDGEIEDKKETLELIEKNNLKYSIYSIGLGTSFDEDLIKNAGIIGKGHYNFCRNLDNLNSIIVSEINKATSPYCSNLKITTNLNDKNIIKNNDIPNTIRNNEIVNLYYITNNNIPQINIEINYIDKENKEYSKKYDISPKIIEKGEDLSILIINNYILNNKDLTTEEALKLALKYQIFMENTSLFAEVILSEKITEEMKLKIIGDKDNNVIKKIIKEERNYYRREEPALCCSYNYGEKFEDYCCMLDCGYDEYDEFEDNLFCLNEMKGIEAEKEEKEERKEKRKKGRKRKEKEKKIELNNKENIMKMINTQDYIEGCWEENDFTKIIIERYSKEYNKLRQIKEKNIDDKTALTILIIYFINKEHSELLPDLIMILKKAKNFITKTTKNEYENLIKLINLE